MTNPVWSHFGLDCLKKAFIMSCQEARGTFLLNIDKIACDKADDQESTLFVHCAESLRHSNVYIFYL